MATKLRLKRMGRKKRPFFRVVVADERSPRDGRFVETVGYYDPTTSPTKVVLKEDRIMYWLDTGAIPTDTVANLCQSKGLMLKRALIAEGRDEDHIAQEVEKFLAVRAAAERKKAEKQAARKTAAASTVTEAPADEPTAAEAPAAETPTEEPAAAEAPVETPAAEGEDKATADNAPAPESPAEGTETAETPSDAAPDAAAAGESEETTATDN